jgi:hypothetical protein
MAVSISTAQINSAAKGNKDLLETLLAVQDAFNQLYQQTGSGPLKKVDYAPTASSSLGTPPVSGLAVTGANGSFAVTITLPQQGTASKNASNAPIYQQLQSSTASDFSSGVTSYPISQNTSFVFPNPGSTQYWRLRSSYDQRSWTSWQTQSGAVSAGKQTSAATENNVSLNQSNFATIDSVANGSTASIRIYGSGGAGTAWTRIVGSNSQVIAAGTILNVAYGSTQYVAWGGTQYQLVPSLTQTFPDGWIPVGAVSVIANGSGVVLPTFKAVVSSGAIVAIQIVTAGNDLTSPPALSIADLSGTGASAVCTVSAGSVTGVTVTNAGSGYSSSPSVTATGGVNNGTAGGGGATGSNGGRLYADV